MDLSVWVLLDVIYFDRACSLSAIISDFKCDFEK